MIRIAPFAPFGTLAAGPRPAPVLDARPSPGLIRRLRALWAAAGLRVRA